MFDELMYRIALHYQPNYGNVLIRKIIKDCGTAKNAFLNPEKALSGVRKYNRHLPKPFITPQIFSLVEKELLWMESHDVHLCFFTDDHYPKRLNSCIDAPYMFYYKGDADFNRPKVVSMVGTRNASQYGKDVVKKIISELKEYNVSIISGLAKGIDTVAHEQALAMGLNTVAVLGSGLGVVYPKSNYKLIDKIVDHGGTLISEYPFMQQPDRQNFPKRNRIIAGLSDATIVIETAQKGGSIITAYIAHSYNRDVFAVPGSVFNTLQDGCNQLIRKNVAAAITSGHELLEMMGWEEGKTQNQNIQRNLFVDLSEEEDYVVNVLKEKGEMPIDEIHCKCTNYPVSKIAGILLGLELKGMIECKPGKVYKLWS